MDGLSSISPEEQNTKEARIYRFLYTIWPSIYNFTNTVFWGTLRGIKLFAIASYRMIFNK